MTTSLRAFEKDVVKYISGEGILLVNEMGEA